MVAAARYCPCEIIRSKPLNHRYECLVARCPIDKHDFPVETRMAQVLETSTGMQREHCQRIAELLHEVKTAEPRAVQKDYMTAKLAVTSRIGIRYEELREREFIIEIEVVENRGDLTIVKQPYLRGHAKMTRLEIPDRLDVFELKLIQTRNLQIRDEIDAHQAFAIILAEHANAELDISIKAKINSSPIERLFLDELIDTIQERIDRLEGRRAN